MCTSFPVFKTPRLFLRQFTDADLENVFRGLSNPEVIKYYGVSYTSLEASKDQMKFFSELEQKGTGIWWAICDHNNHKFYGAAGFNNLIKEHKKAEIGFWLLPEHWGRGIINEALPIILNFGFNKLNLHRIEALVETENLASKKVLANAGFIYEGTLRDFEIKNGRFISLEVYAKFNLNKNDL
jgi:[ribosomal protein S5]-alanine N-acetyltransferase